MNTPNDQSVKSYFQILTFIHLAMCSGLLLFLGISVFLNHSTLVTEWSDPVLWIALANTMTLLPLSLFVHAFLVKGKRVDTSAGRKNVYQLICIIRWALIEGAGMFNVVMFFVRGNVLYLGLAAFCIAALIFQRPSEAEQRRLLG